MYSRKAIFYLKLNFLDIERQRLCIAGQRQKTRVVSIQYFFRKEGVRTRVCNKFCTSTLNIGHSPVTEAIKGRIMSGAIIGVDNRERHVSSNKTPESDLKRIREHIDKFPRTPSHYTRSSSTREHLDPKLSTQKMYELYVDDSTQNRPDSKPVVAGVYQQVFYTEYNLAFFKPKNTNVKYAVGMHCSLVQRKKA